MSENMGKYRNLISKLKNKIRKWLGFDDMFIGVDVGITDESCVIVVSKQKGGQIRIMDVRFGSYGELNAFVKQTQARYGIPNNSVVWDVPYSMRIEL